MKRVLVIDIGGTNIKYGIVNRNLELQENFSVKTPAQGSGNTEAVLKEIISQFPDVDGIGFSIAAGYDQQMQKAVSISSSVPDLAEIDFNALGNGLKVAVENDVNSFALAELHAGNAKGLSNVSVVVIGTSIGGGVIINGQLFSGKRGNAGEFGATLLQDYEVSPFVGAEAGCRGLLTKVNRISGDRYSLIEEFYNLDDPEIQAVIRKNNRHISTMIGNIIAVLGPERVLIGGPITKEAGYLEEQIENLNQIEPEYLEFCDIMRCKHTDKGALIGVASKLIRDEFLHRDKV